MFCTQCGAPVKPEVSKTPIEIAKHLESKFNLHSVEETDNPKNSGVHNFTRTHPHDETREQFLFVFVGTLFTYLDAPFAVKTDANEYLSEIVDKSEGWGVIGRRSSLCLHTTIATESVLSNGQLSESFSIIADKLLDTAADLELFVLEKVDEVDIDGELGLLDSSDVHNASRFPTCPNCSNSEVSGRYCDQCGCGVEQLQGDLESEMSIFKFQLTLKTFPIEWEFGSEWTSYWKSSSEFLTLQHSNAGGSHICLNPQADLELLSEFMDLETEEYSGTIKVESEDEGIEIISTKGTPEEGWEFLYVMVSSTTVKIKGQDAESAKLTALDAAKRLFMIYDEGALDELTVEHIICREITD